MNFSQTMKIYQQIFPTRIIRTKFEPGAKADMLMIATLVGTIGIQVDNYSQTYLSMQLPVHSSTLFYYKYCVKLQKLEIGLGE